MVFGGYLHQSWKGAGAWQKAEKAFVFSMTKKTKHEQFQHFEHAVYFERTFHIWFGYDILLYNNCNNNSSSYSKLGYVYEGP